MAYNGAGIYGLYNVMEDKIYIGSSSNIGKRFAQHRANFRAKSDSFPMYKEPIENFVFLVLYKMSDEDYKKYGSMMEQLFIERAKIDWMPVYNRNCTDGAIYSVFRAFGMFDTIQDTIREKCGTKRAWIKMRGEKGKREVCESIKESERWSA